MEHTAQQARENWANLLNTVQFTEQTVTITKHGKPTAQITPVGDPWVVTVDTLGDNGVWDPIGAPEVIYTTDINVRLSIVAENYATDHGNPPGSEWRAQAWPGSDPSVIPDREPWAWSVYKVADTAERNA